MKFNWSHFDFPGSQEHSTVDVEKEIRNSGLKGEVTPIDTDSQPAYSEGEMVKTGAVT